MTQYKIYFSSGNILVVTPEQLGIFFKRMEYTPLMDDVPLIGYFGIDYIIREVITQTTAVITPPTPAQLRAEKEEERQNQPVTLEDQLDNPEVGK